MCVELCMWRCAHVCGVYMCVYVELCAHVCMWLCVCFSSLLPKQPSWCGGTISFPLDEVCAGGGSLAAKQLHIWLWIRTRRHSAPLLASLPARTSGPSVWGAGNRCVLVSRCGMFLITNYVEQLFGCVFTVHFFYWVVLFSC